MPDERTNDTTFVYYPDNFRLAFPENKVVWVIDVGDLKMNPEGRIGMVVILLHWLVVTQGIF